MTIDMHPPVEKFASPPNGRKHLMSIAVLHGIWLIIIIICAAAFLLNPHTFLTLPNIRNILIQSAVLGVLVVAESLVLLVGHFDLSLESTMAFTAMFGAWLMGRAAPSSGWGLPPLVAVVAILTVGGLIGAFNAFLVVKIRMNAFIATLGMLILFRGLTLAFTSGRSIYGLPDGFTWIGSKSINNVPIGAVVMLLIFLSTFLVLRFRVYGKKLYAVGGNESVAFAAGIHTSRVIALAFIAAGVLSAIAGWILAGRLEASVAGMGQGIIFDVMAAAVIGGISLKGGRGYILDALGGVLLLGVIGNMLTLASVSPFWVDAVRGALIIAAMTLDTLRDRVDALERRAARAVA